jgi:hypothetical protein
LVGVLFLVVLLSMFIGASFELGIWGFKGAVNQSEVAAAQRAARSGLAYALSRLRNDSSWKARPANPLVVNSPDLVVVEEDGIVIGLLRNGEQTSQFRLRFNYYDGAGGADALDNPSAAMRVDWSRICMNNLAGGSEVDIPLADGPGGSVPASPSSYGQLPAQGVFLAVEGRCGRWLRQASAAAPNPVLPVGMKASLAHVESVYKISRPPNGARAVAAASGNLVAILADVNRRHNLALSSASTSILPRIRSQAAVAVYGGDSSQPNLVAGSRGGQYGSVLSPNGLRLGPTMNAVPENPGDPMLNVGWDELNKAVPDVDPNQNVLRGGVYSVWQDGSLHYYDTDMAGYQLLMTTDQTNAGVTPASLPASMGYQFRGGKATLAIRENTYVEPTGTTDDFVFVSKSGADGGPGVVNPQLNLIPGVTDTLRSDALTVAFRPPRGQSAVLTSLGKVSLGARVVGEGGSITAEEHISIVGTGVDMAAENNPKEGVSLYTKQDILVSTYDDAAVDTYKKAAFKGVLYAWGNIKMMLGHEDIPRGRWGPLEVTGAMVAYGKDPTDLVGPVVPKEIRMVAREVNLKYDDSYVQSMIGGVPPNFELQRVRWLQD